jgi:hypothetical protein
MSVDPALIWKTFCEEFPDMICTAPQGVVVQEFTRRGYQTEADLERFLAGVRFDGWWQADFADGHPVGWHGSPRNKFINVYEMEQAYGGPEEGGWYYPTGTPLASVPVDFDAPESETDPIREQLFVRFGRRFVSIYIEDHFAEHFPQTRPHYE